MFLIVPFGDFHIFFSLNSLTRSSSGVMVAHLMPTLYFLMASAQSIVTVINKEKTCKVSLLEIKSNCKAYFDHRWRLLIPCRDRRSGSSSQGMVKWVSPWWGPRWCGSFHRLAFLQHRQLGSLSTFFWLCDSAQIESWILTFFFDKNNNRVSYLQG